MTAGVGQHSSVSLVSPEQDDANLIACGLSRPGVVDER